MSTGRPGGTARRSASVAAAVVALVATAACSSPSPRDTRYTFKAGDSPVQVDTPELRALKSAAGIAPCPTVRVTAATAAGDLPNATLPCLGGGRAVDLAGLRGPLLLNFWAQYCGPCRKESPLLQQFATQAKGQVHVVGVDFKDVRPGMALEFAKRYGITYPQLADPDGGAQAALRLNSLPVTLLIDASGQVVYTNFGELTSASDIASLVKEHLGVSVPVGSGS